MYIPEFETKDQRDSPKSGGILCPSVKSALSAVANSANQYGAMDLPETDRML
jgi:hypothetical protein